MLVSFLPLLVPFSFVSPGLFALTQLSAPRVLCCVAVCSVSDGLAVEELESLILS